MSRLRLLALCSLLLLLISACAPASPTGDTLQDVVPLDDTRPTFIFFYTDN